MPFNPCHVLSQSPKKYLHCRVLWKYLSLQWKTSPTIQSIFESVCPGIIWKGENRVCIFRLESCAVPSFWEQHAIKDMIGWAFLFSLKLEQLIPSATVKEKFWNIFNNFLSSLQEDRGINRSQNSFPHLITKIKFLGAFFLFLFFFKDESWVSCWRVPLGPAGTGIGRCFCVR